MTTDKKTLANVQPGGRVRLGHHHGGEQAEPAWLARADAWMTLEREWAIDGMPADKQRLARAAFDAASSAVQAERERWFTRAGEYLKRAQAAEYALAAQPSPAGQGDGRSARAATFLRQYLTYLRNSPRQGLRPRWCDVYEALEVAIDALAARQPVGQEPVAIPEGWALVDLAEYTILPQIPTTAMMDAGWPIGEQITDQFDVKGAYADLIAEHEAKGEGIIHGPIHLPAQAVDLGPGLDAAAKLIQKKADDYAEEFGYDDMGGLSFGRGLHAEVKSDHHFFMLELVDELRALIDGKGVGNG